MIRMIIRADDVGYCEAVNYGIAKTVKEGLVRSVGIMPNMPSAAHGIGLLEGTGVCMGSIRMSALENLVRNRIGFQAC